MGSPPSHRHSRPAEGELLPVGTTDTARRIARVMKWHFRPINGFVKRKIHKIGDILLTTPQNIVFGWNGAFKRKLGLRRAKSLMPSVKRTCEMLLKRFVRAAARSPR